MTQEEIIDLLKEKECLFASEIIEILKKGSERESIRICLKQLRRYNEIGFVLVTYENKKKLGLKYEKVKEYDLKGYIRKPCYLYFLVNK